MYSLREMVLHKHKNLCGSSVQQTLRKFRRFVRNCLKFLFRLVYLFGFPWCEMKADLVLFWGLLFFFLIGKKKYIQKTARCKKHQHIKSTKKEVENKNKKHKLQRKRAKEKRKRVTRCESPSPNLVKQGTRKESKHLVFRSIQILERPLIAFLPNTPHQTQWN